MSKPPETCPQCGKLVTFRATTCDEQRCAYVRGWLKPDESMLVIGKDWWSEAVKQTKEDLERAFNLTQH